MPQEIKKTEILTSRNQTAIWVASTVVFALLFFLSSVLDMKVKVSFGQAADATGTTTTTRTVSPTTTSAPAGGIASQVGGC